MYPLKAVILLGLIALSLTPILSPPLALILGILFAIILGNPWLHLTSKYNKPLLKIVVVGLGFNLNISEILQSGQQAILLTLTAIVLIMLTGLLLGRLFQIHNNISILISAGTAICGGSAIAAMAPVIRSDNHQTAVSLATIFLLNGIAMLVFPPIGHFFHLSNESFGTWAAIAIHDTSSVVGATATYGSGALTIGLIVKLTRALWIFPLTFAVGFFYRTKHKAPFPLFLIGFLIAATLNALFPQLSPLWQSLSSLSTQLLTLTLFLIGTSLTRDLLKNIGLRPFLQGFTLWILVSLTSLLAILT